MTTSDTPPHIVIYRALSISHIFSPKNSGKMSHNLNIKARYRGSFVSSLSMITSSNGNIFHVTGPLCKEFTGHRWIPPQRPVMRSFDVFFDLCLNKWLSKQPWRQWCELPSRSLCHHCNAEQIFRFLPFVLCSVSCYNQRYISRV